MERPAEHARPRAGRRMLHVCVGWSPGRLASIPDARGKARVLGHIRELAARLSTVFVVAEGTGLPSSARRLIPGANLLQAPGRNALGAPRFLQALDRYETVVLTGLETSGEVYATAYEIAALRHWNVILPEEAVIDRHASAHGSCLHLLGQGFGRFVSVVPIASLLATLQPVVSAPLEHATSGESRGAGEAGHSTHASPAVGALPPADRGPVMTGFPRSGMTSMPVHDRFVR